ncbi:MAG: hypothetical protein KME15_03535 [Drouetiella hepatica Uher 2000/2452]|jgi:hypothetical protein|uniref:Uncharacterized protein n=1 Tax=Drouetiella hepatica Uher 2000/2452 TaxID=904376 RepID=A0A951Q9E2_9CYAN|nr:hypothetical protein [Drouetiella hepatica Uher 2000/2452]
MLGAALSHDLFTVAERLSDRRIFQNSFQSAELDLAQEPSLRLTILNLFNRAKYEHNL